MDINELLQMLQRQDLRSSKSQEKIDEDLINEGCINRITEESFMNAQTGEIQTFSQRNVAVLGCGHPVHDAREIGGRTDCCGKIVCFQCLIHCAEDDSHLLCLKCSYLVDGLRYCKKCFPAARDRDLLNKIFSFLGIRKGPDRNVR